MSAVARKRDRSCGSPGVDFAAALDFLRQLKAKGLRRVVRAEGEGVGEAASADAQARAKATLVFDCAGEDGESLEVPCGDFMEWMLSSMQSDSVSADNVGELDEHLHVLLMFADHEGLRGVLLDTRLLVPFVCLSFRIFFDLLNAGAPRLKEADTWLHVLLLLLFKMCNLDNDGAALVLQCFQRSGAEDFAYVVHSLMRVAADNLRGSVGSHAAQADGGGHVRFMSKCASAVGKGTECVGCLAVDLISMLCCSSPDSVSYAVLSHALKPSLVMTVTLALFQRLSAPALTQEHEFLAVSWLVKSPPPPQRAAHATLRPPTSPSPPPHSRSRLIWWCRTTASTS